MHDNEHITFRRFSSIELTDSDGKRKLGNQNLILKENNEFNLNGKSGIYTETEAAIILSNGMTFYKDEHCLSSFNVVLYEIQTIIDYEGEDDGIRYSGQRCIYNAFLGSND